MSLTRREALAAWLGVLGGLVASPWITGRKEEGGEKGPRWGFITDMHVRDHYDGFTYSALLKMMIVHGCEWIIVGGDAVNDGFKGQFDYVKSAERVAYKKVLDREENLPVYHAEGNHDRRLHKDEAWKVMGLPAPYYTVDLGPYKFVFLSPNGEKAPYTLPEEQIEWASQYPGCILVSHVPLVSIVGGGFVHGGPPLAFENGAAALKRIKPKMVLHGHTHLPEDVEAFGAKIHGGGSMCGYWWNRVPGGPARPYAETIQENRGFTIFDGLTPNRVIGTDD